MISHETIIGRPVQGLQPVRFLRPTAPAKKVTAAALSEKLLRLFPVKVRIAPELVADQGMKTESEVTAKGPVVEIFAA